MSKGSAMFSQYFPPKAKWGVDDIPDLSGQVIIVTGGNAGVGFETVKALLAHNAKVYIAGRSEKKVNEAIKELQTQTGKTAFFMPVDLSDLRSIKKGVDEFVQKESRLDVLFNNAGVMWPAVEMVTAQNIDLQWGTNVLGHFYLTKLLAPTMIATAAAQGKPSRIIHTASSAAQSHPATEGVKIETFSDGPERKKRTTEVLYGQSKLGNVILSNEFARRYADQGLVNISCNPGNLRSDLTRHIGGVKKKVIYMMCHPVPLGALTQLWGGTSSEGVKHNGGYLIPWARVGVVPPQSQDAALNKAVWEWMEEQVAKVEAQ
ncbi:hypothetical protein FB45DRAFT_943100 [Roridomyces roridus]|uniref:NAD(P)-binding protein n=1 Tax=Roridomyces roridus TaxID=1738132 RepID=A0AAD7B4J4_9AGAR|nr:hypothetical protein FB45DRAFT_943100 [Roridomyces roridus]